MKKPQISLLLMLALSALLCLAVLFSGYFQAYRQIVAGVALAMTLFLYFCTYMAQKHQQLQQQQRMDAVFSENATAASRVINDVSIPCLLIDETGRVVWRNALFEKLCGEEMITKIMPKFNPKIPLAAAPFTYAGGSYQIMNMPIYRPGTDRQLNFQYWLDRTEAAHYKRLFEEQMPYVALIYVDNYEELAADMQFHQTTVLAEVERLISDTAKEINGIYRRYENGRFLLIFEAQRLDALEEQRFPMLDAAHRIDTGTNVSVSLSIAVGVADRINQSDESARQAMELALGRGGDQAVIKIGTNYRFYGGKRQLESMPSRVKSRQFSKALRQLFENAGDVFIMGHKRADMDCIGAALGVATCAKQIGSRTYIILDDNNTAIDRVLALIQQNRSYAGCIISVEQAEKMIKSTSVLVVVDTQRPSTTCAPQLLDMVSRIVVVDHHRRSAEHVENPTLHYLESRASSTSELITEALQYFDDDLRPPAFICGALLAGITVDTKHFAFNVGSRTFEAAGYLRKNGADIGMVKQLFQDDMERFGDCADTVRGADVLQNGIAVAAVAEGVKNAKLVAAKAADELVGIRGIEAAFVIGREDGSVSISGRSLGKVNVQLVCEKLGGGGHLTMAGAQLDNMEADDAELLLRTKIAEYVQETARKT
ncbi:MAG: DHH family phosphoesterase [Clostridia bacterium]